MTRIFKPLAIAATALLWLLLVLDSIHGAEWNLFVSSDVAQQAPVWQLFEPARSAAPPSAAAPAHDEWQLFAAQADTPKDDPRPIVDVDCPEGDWCTPCLRWKHDPRVPEREWIETASLPFRLRFNPVPDDRHRGYPAFRFIDTAGRERTYLGPSRSSLLSIWKQNARDAQ
jgi:hypothetical protein